MTGLLLTAALLATLPVDTALRDDVACIEVQHFYDDQAKLVFDQVVFWRWCKVKCCEEVQDWRLLKNESQWPRRDYRAGDYVARWWDGDAFREVRAPTIRERWLQWDVELLDRDKHPVQDRRKLIMGGLP